MNEISLPERKGIALPGLSVPKVFGLPLLC